MINAVILAGDNDKSSGELHNKATCLIGDKMMIEYVISALKNSQYISKILIIGDKAKLESLEREDIKLLQSTDSLVDNILLGIKSFKDEQVLISTSDIPMVSEEAIRDFIIKGLEARADLAYSVIIKNTMVDKFPQAHRTYVKLKDGEFTGGNLFLVQTPKIYNALEIGQKMIMYRKNPWKMCRLLGLGFLFKLAIGKLAIEDVEKRVAQIMNIKGRAIISDFAEVGNDVDKPEDLEMTIKYMTESS